MENNQDATNAIEGSTGLQYRNVETGLIVNFRRPSNLANSPNEDFIKHLTENNSRFQSCLNVNRIFGREVWILEEVQTKKPAQGNPLVIAVISDAKTHETKMVLTGTSKTAMEKTLLLLVK